ncbi:MAG: helix-hairpin-helix domain-containing protein [Nitrospirae bacterium]|nr:helix-hairpin-helix domain-containing protein [Nitrospirota bacterium]
MTPQGILILAMGAAIGAQALDGANLGGRRPAGGGETAGPSGPDVAEVQLEGRRHVVSADASTAGLAIDPVRGLLFFRRMPLNRVDERDLNEIPGVGPALARRIVELRDGLGRPLTRHDLGHLPGVGPVTLETLDLYVDIP